MADRRRNPQSENGGLADHDRERPTRICNDLLDWVEVVKAANIKMD
jgi:hypothetical protein